MVDEAIGGVYENLALGDQVAETGRGFPGWGDVAEGRQALTSDSQRGAEAARRGGCDPCGGRGPRPTGQAGGPDRVGAGEDLDHKEGLLVLSLLDGKDMSRTERCSAAKKVLEAVKMRCDLPRRQDLLARPKKAPSLRISGVGQLF